VDDNLARPGAEMLFLRIVGYLVHRPIELRPLIAVISVERDPELHDHPPNLSLQESSEGLSHGRVGSRPRCPALVENAGGVADVEGFAGPQSSHRIGGDCLVDR
jgi:hypothetical protein